MLDGLPSQPAFHDVDRVLESAGQVLDTLQTRFAEDRASWLPRRRWKASRALDDAIGAVDAALRALLVDEDVRASVDLLSAALPNLRSAWAWGTLQTV